MTVAYIDVDTDIERDIEAIKKIEADNQPEHLIDNIIKSNASQTSYGNSIYSDLWYVDNKNKLCITFTPRGGCSISFQQYLDLLGLLSDGLNYNPFIHEYRINIFLKYALHQNIDDLLANKYTFIKFIMNPYIRAVSVYRAQTSHDLSFRQYLIKLVNNEIGYFNVSDKYHLEPQYIDGEENVITKYLKINENETFDITLQDGTLYTLDPNRYTSVHHGEKNITNTTFCGDTPRNIVNNNLSSNYKYFYDDEIRKMVETFYTNDIYKYGFTFESAFF